MGILANHVPSIEQLKPGLVEIIEESGGSKQYFHPSIPTSTLILCILSSFPSFNTSVLHKACQFLISMPCQALSVEEVTCISSRMCTTNLPSNTILAGTVSSLIQSWNNLNKPDVSRPRSSSLRNITTLRNRRASLAVRNEFLDANSTTVSPSREKSNSSTPKLGSPTSTCPRPEKRDHATAKEKSPVSTTSKGDSPVSTLPRSTASVTDPPEGEIPCATAGEKWHGKSWVKRDFVGGKNGSWIRPASSARTPSISPAGATPTEEEESKAEETTPVDPWSPLAEGDNRTGLRRRPSTRHPTEQRRCLPESWYRSPNHDEDDSSSVSTSDAHHAKPKAIGRKYGLDFEPAEEKTDCQMKHEQLHRKAHIRNHRRCHRCGEEYHFYNICLRCGHKRCRECPRSSPERPGGEEGWATTSSYSVQEERKPSSLLPMMRAASSYAESASHDSDDDAEERSAYIEALIDDIDNAITTAGRRYDSSQGESSQGEDSEDDETIVEVDQKQTSPLRGFPDPPKKGDDANSLCEKNVRIPAAGYDRRILTDPENFLSPDDLGVTRELNENTRSSRSTSSPSPPQSILPSGNYDIITTRFRAINANTAVTVARSTWPTHVTVAVNAQHRPPPVMASPCHLLVAAKTQVSPKCMIIMTNRLIGVIAHRQFSSSVVEASDITAEHSVIVATATVERVGVGLARTTGVAKPPVQPPTTPTAATATQPQPPPAGPSARWTVPTHSLRKPERGDDSVGIAADLPQSRLWRAQQPTSEKMPGRPQQSKSLPVTRKTSDTAVANTKHSNIATVTADKPQREAINQGSVAARAMAWEQSAAAVVGTLPPSATQDKGKKGKQEGGRESGDSLASKPAIKEQATDDDASDQKGASPREDWQVPEDNSINRIRVIVEVIGDADKGYDREVEQCEARGRKGKKWMVEFDVGLDFEVGSL
ncbi:hypothetical protein GP486_005979 [Trichoglossum hirsutum]|uniref:Uncharacterized protein n=1 Tax=Trichoglossum hirsutum TaxID=265104 RepID=A0A9P8L878_9PEZI|nr:hypothetical protein GP486_005979 [Trichoglossum hirsutum]